MSRKVVRATLVLLLASIISVQAFILATSPQARAVVPIILNIAIFVLGIAAVLRIYTAAVVLGWLLGVIGALAFISLIIRSHSAEQFIITLLWSLLLLGTARYMLVNASVKAFYGRTPELPARRELSAITQFDGPVCRAFEGQVCAARLCPAGRASQFPFPQAVGIAGSGTGSRRLGAGLILIVGGVRSVAGELVAFVGLGNAAGGGEGGEALVQGGGADAAAPAQFGERHGGGDVGKCCGDALVDRGRGWGGRLGRVDDLQGEGGPALAERDGDGGERRRGAMLDGQRQVIAVAAQIEVGIAPGVELG